MGKVLFICAGNVARSQMAEAFYNTFTHSQIATSAGILPHTPAKYKNPITEVVDVMREEGIDVSAQTVKLVSPDMIQSAEKVFVLCSRNELPDFILQKPNLIFWKISDPFGTTAENFRLIRNIIKEKVLTIIPYEKKGD